MTDNSELKRLAEACGDLSWRAIQENWCEWAIRDDHGYIATMRTKSAKYPGPCPDREAKAKFLCAITPSAVLTLIAESARLQSAAKTLERLGYRDNGGELWKPPLGQKPDFSLMDQLKAEKKRLESEAVYAAAGFDAAREEIARIKAENAGLKTGYEAYERVNAELKAENEALRKDAESRIEWAKEASAEIDRLQGIEAECEALRDNSEQNQYDANAWRNGEESVWIEVFNSEGDDPFISAITGQITVEQLALIQGEILEYREDYFEKGSGLYVFRCAHHQAHHDNVGMTEPAHWETDFESYSPFPWEEEAAAMGKGELS